jgi:hypothetical protein
VIPPCDFPSATAACDDFARVTVVPRRVVVVVVPAVPAPVQTPCGARIITATARPLAQHRRVVVARVALVVVVVVARTTIIALAVSNARTLDARARVPSTSRARGSSGDRVPNVRTQDTSRF